MNSLYDYFNCINDKNKISHSYLIGNVNFDTVKNDLYKIFSDFIFKNNTSSENNPDVYIIRPVNGIVPKDDIKDLISEISTTSQFNNNKIYVIDGAEKLNDFSYNAILKTLEEPKDNIYAFLLTNNIDSIKPTISSRCQKIFISSEIVIDEFEDNIKEIGDKLIELIEKYNINTIGVEPKIYTLIDSRETLSNVLNYMLKKYFDMLKDLIYNSDGKKEEINILSNKIIVIDKNINNLKNYLNKNLVIDRLIIELWRCNNENC